MRYLSTKRYGHEQGLSCAFRQWRATSHCNQLHGYALAFKFTFGANELDERNWVMDFGGLKKLKEKLVLWFDHTVCVAEDDPEHSRFVALYKAKLIDMRTVQSTGCESFAALAWGLAHATLLDMDVSDRVKVLSAECAEHGANSAIYRPQYAQDLLGGCHYRAPGPERLAPGGRGTTGSLGDGEPH